jgi:anti-sigma B factor antagonist
MNTITSSGETTTLKLDRDVVAAHCGELRENLRQLVASGARSVLLDFSDVRMVDSAGLGMLIAAHNSFKKNQGEVSVTNCSADILELFHSMRLHQHMKIEGTQLEGE